IDDDARAVVIIEARRALAVAERADTVAGIATAIAALHLAADGGHGFGWSFFHERGGYGLQEAGRYGLVEAAATASHACVREIRLALRACDPDVEQPPLFLQRVRIVVGPAEREESLLHSADEHERILETLCVVQCHERDGVRAGV